MTEGFWKATEGCEGSRRGSFRDCVGIVCCRGEPESGERRGRLRVLLTSSSRSSSAFRLRLISVWFRMSPCD